ncbi:MAG TPA: universal stress protein [Nitrososphaeraceae archaeon]|nr:universal stress protein [Nitrososphaeraceae archaeon]
MVNRRANPVSLKKILVPVDGSEISIKAANYAIHVAKLVNAELILINIIEDVKQGGAIGLQERYGNISIVKAFKKARKQSAEESLMKIQNSAKSGVKVKSVILDADGKNEKKMVTEYAVKNNVNLIIIGSKGQSRFKGLWVGGFTNSVLHHSTVPVLVVP